MPIVIQLDDSFSEIFENIIEKTAFKDASQIISNAIALLDLACEAKEFGFKLGIIDEKGEIEDYIDGF
jgi:hypothetical protein